MTDLQMVSLLSIWTSPLRLQVYAIVELGTFREWVLLRSAGEL